MKLKHFILIGRLEAISFLSLLLIAMPLKYIFDLPLMVKYVGWAHGLLFVFYMGALAFIGLERNWKISKLFVLFIAAFIPAGPFLMEKRVLRNEE